MNDPVDPAPAITPGTLLAGRVRYAQLATGYRTGIEPVLLAAAVPARPGQRVIEAGCGAGAALLCLAARVPGVTGLGVEQDARLAALATDNARANGWAARLGFAAAHLEHYRSAERFDHAMANPPWHHPAGTTSANSGRAAAKCAPAGLLPDWVAALAGLLKPRGTLSLILATQNMNAALAALAAHRCGSVRLLPLWPRPDREARMVLLQSVLGGRAATRLLPGLVLHGAEGYAPSARRILEHGDHLFPSDPGPGRPSNP